MQQQLFSKAAQRRLSGPRRGCRELVRRAPLHTVKASYGPGSFPEEQEAADPQTSTSYSPAARRAYARIVTPQRIGAEYGEVSL